MSKPKTSLRHANDALNHTLKVLEAKYDNFSFVGVVILPSGKEARSIRFSVYHNDLMIKALKEAIERLEKGERGMPQRTDDVNDPNFVDKVWVSKKKSE